MIVNSPKQNTNSAAQWERTRVAEVLDKQKLWEGSLVDLAKETGIPRTTIQHWNARTDLSDLPPAMVEFFESSVGEEFLHRLFVSLMFDLHEHGNASLRCLTTFLRKTQLDRFISVSKSSLERAARNVQCSTIQFADQEKERLSKLMPEKNISIAEDETFPNGTCMVAMELRSNFIILERMVPDRKTATWDSQMEDALKGMPVKVIQSVGDEAKSLVRHVKAGLGAHHSPDTFHIQQEVTKAGSAQLKLKIKRETEKLVKLNKKTEKLEKKQTAHQSLDKKPVGRPIDYDSLINKSTELERDQAEQIRAAIQNNTDFHSARISISDIYHPYNIKSGIKQAPLLVGEKLNNAFDTIENIVSETGNAFEKRIAKARKLVSAMEATIAFYFATVAIILDQKNYDQQSRMLLEDFLIPACYLEFAASKSNDKDKAIDMRYLKKELMAEYDSRAGPFSLYTSREMDDILNTAKECSAVFQRSSSAVEGRNGQLSLNYHNLHRLSDRKLACLTAIHNFDTRRADCTTPAERFFEEKHGDLFEYLLKNVKRAGRPRIRSFLKRAV
ncbi:MAG: hypothetical protein HQL32_10430 [Planctomycetes bacterium]|nr:hypothetical protein [Planctomycetota bacterium]